MGPGLVGSEEGCVTSRCLVNLGLKVASFGVSYSELAGRFGSKAVCFWWCSDTDSDVTFLSHCHSYKISEQFGYYIINLDNTRMKQIRNWLKYVNMVL